MQVLLCILLQTCFELLVVFTDQSLEHVGLYSILGVLNLLLFFLCLTFILDFLGHFLLRVSAACDSIYQLRNLAQEAFRGEFGASEQMNLGFILIAVTELREGEQYLNH